MSVTIRIAGPEDAETVSALACDTFTETFGHLYASEDLNAFLHDAYRPDAVRAEIADPTQRWWLAEDEGRAVAYAQAGRCALPHEDVGANDGELKRIYVRGSHRNGGVGRALLGEVFDWLEAEYSGPHWIGVWSENLGAQRLYGRYGFERVGAYDFLVGRQRDHEFILRRA